MPALLASKVVVKIRPRQTTGHDEHGTVNMDFFQYRETLTEARTAQKKLPEWNSEIEEYDDVWDDYATDLAVARDTDDEDAEDMAKVDFEDHFTSAKKKGKIGKYTVRSVKAFDTLAAWDGSDKYVIFITAGNKLGPRNCYVTGSDKDLDKSDLASLELEMKKQRIK